MAQSMRFHALYWEDETFWKIRGVPQITEPLGIRETVLLACTMKIPEDKEYEQGGPEMKKTTTIVVPIDFLDTSTRLVDYAVYMAGKLSAVIHFVHAVYFYSNKIMLGIPYVQECEEKLIIDAKERMANLIAGKSERCPGCTGEVVTGDPVDKITEIAMTKQADLIIISTHGAKGLEKILLGSVTERVLKRAHCPVLVMNPFKEHYS